jgi:hypothetical protein
LPLAADGREMGFFWPTKIKAEPGAFARLGRVLHWLCVAIAAIAVFINLSNYINATQGYEREYSLQFAGIVGGGLFMLGRAIRYIFSGE